MRRHIVFVLGVTCSGKTTFLRSMLKQGGSQVRTIEVGQELRKRYPPEVFRGEGAPEVTEQEALSIYRDQVSDALVSGAKYILVDGQPRKTAQIEPVLAHVWPHLTYEDTVTVLFLTCSEQEIRRRIESRCTSPTDRELSMSRINRDAQDLYHVHLGLLLQSQRRLFHTRVIDTEQTDVTTFPINRI